MSELKERRFLIRKPKALQYFHHGQLKRESEKERVAGRFELFFDLLYVAIVANFSELVTEEPTVHNVVKYILIFIPAWHAWADAKENANNYYNDDMLQRVGYLCVMALLTVYGNNANYVTDSISAMRFTVASYMILRFFQISYYAVYSIASPHHRTQNRCYFGMILIGMVIWIPLFFESLSMKAKVGVAIAGIAWEEMSYILTFGPWIARWLKLEFSTAVDIDHENDRYTAFTILILGEFTYGIIVGSPATGGINTRIGRAILTLIIAFCFNSMYVYNDGSVEHLHPIRRSVGSSVAWLLIHLPLSAGLLLGGHVSAATVELKELNTPQRWLWGGGLGLATLCMFGIALLYKSMDEPRFLRFSKTVRLFPRLIMGIIFILLPLIPEKSLSTTDLLGIGAGMTAFVLIWETFGSMECGACIFESWRDTPNDESDIEDLIQNESDFVERP